MVDGNTFILLLYSHKLYRRRNKHEAHKIRYSILLCIYYVMNLDYQITIIGELIQFGKNRVWFRLGIARTWVREQDEQVEGSGTELDGDSVLFLFDTKE